VTNGTELDVCPAAGCGWYLHEGRCARCEALGAPIVPTPVTPEVTPPPSQPEQTPDLTASTPPKSSPEPELEAPEHGSETSQEPAHTWRVPAHGVGLLRVGNPGNRGGRSYPSSIKGELRRILDEHGLELVERVVRRLEPEYRVVRKHVGETSKGQPIYADEIVAVPCSIGEALRSVAIAVAAAETRPATEKPGANKRQVLEVVMQRE
jgi:hypothetical protein